MSGTVVGWLVAVRRSGPGRACTAEPFKCMALGMFNEGLFLKISILIRTILKISISVSISIRTFLKISIIISISIRTFLKISAKKSFFSADL